MSKTKPKSAPKAKPKSKQRGQYTAQQFIEAIKNSGGIISTIASRVGCEWHTARRYINEYPTVKQAYDSERETILDAAESVIYKSIQANLKKPDGEEIDTKDAKWLLSRLAKDRGYVERQEMSGPDGKPIIIKGYGSVSPDDWDDDDGD